MEIRLVCPHCGSAEITRHWYSPDYHGSHIVYYWRCETCEKEFDTPIGSEEFPEARRRVRVEAAAEDMYRALKQIAEMDPGEHEELIEIARETLKKAGLLDE